MIKNIRKWLRSPKRSLKHFWQRRTRGWDDSDTWSLDHTILEFTLPRLKRYKELASLVVIPNYCETTEEFEESLELMIYYIETFLEDSDRTTDDEKYDKGQEHFHKYFHALWW